ncbi:hypothetical protein D3C87_40230 [compost metagenome]
MANITLKTFGMDYGLKPTMAVAGDFSFVENFQKAVCKGLAYITCPDTNGEPIPCEIGFMMKEEKYAELFLESLISWKENSNGDSQAVDLHFFEQNNGEYMLSISANVMMFMSKMIPEHIIDHVSPLSIIAYQSKGGMQIGENYKIFKDQYLQGRKIVVRYFIVDNDNALIKRSEKYLIKSEFKFSKEGEVDDDNLPNPLINKSTKKRKPQKIESDDPSVLETRKQKLHYFFPITCNRMEKQGWLSELVSTINPRYSQEQIIQSICNIVLHERLLLHGNSAGFLSDDKGFSLNLIEYLAENHESFDSFFPEDSFFTKQIIEKQIRVDEKFFKLNSTK